jgi:hypothetical protein
LSDDANELEQAALSINQGSLRPAPGSSKEQVRFIVIMTIILMLLLLLLLL